MIKAIFIDVDNTLLDFNLCAKSSMKQAFALHGVEYRDELFPVFQKRNDLLWAEIEKGALTVERLYEIRWNLVFADMGIENIDGALFEREFLSFLHGSAEPVEYARELLEYLSAKYLIYIVSNAPYMQQRTRLEKADMLRFTSGVFTSESIGKAKPDAAFYDGCFEQLEGIDKSEVLLIGDSLTADIGGGIAYGLKTCWFNPANANAPAELKPDFTVSSLKAIINIV